MLLFNEALNILNEYKDKKGERAIFRGEAELYPFTLSSIDRLSPPYQKSLSMVLPNLTNHIWDKKISRHLDDMCGFTLYKGKEFGANDLINPDDGMESMHTFRPLVALMQHYGIPTPWIDFTRDPYVSMLFASQRSESDVGYIYYGDYWRLSNKGVIIDLSSFIEDLREILPLPVSRPEKQHGLAFRPIKEKCGREGMIRIKFKKDYSISDNIDSLFPRDALRAWLMGQIVDYYMDYIERSRRFNIEVKKIDPDNDTAGLRSALEYVITELDLWR